MKSHHPVVSLALFAATSLAKPRGHFHGHLHTQEDRAFVQEHVSVTVVECVLGDRVISEEECERGIQNGSLRWADDGLLLVASSMTSTISVRHRTLS